MNTIVTISSIIAESVSMTDNPWLNNGLAGMLAYILFKVMGWVFSVFKSQQKTNDSTLEEYKKLLDEERTARKEYEAKSDKERKVLEKKIQKLEDKREEKSEQYLSCMIDSSRYQTENEDLKRAVARLEGQIQTLQQSNGFL